MVYAINIGEEFAPIGTTFTTFGKLVSVLLPNLYILAGLVMFILLIFGGLSLIMGGGGGNPQQADRGKQAVTAAVVGFILIFISWWIIQIIETITGIPIFKSGF